MVVGVLQLELSLPGANSLKDKRRVIKSLIQKNKNRYNISIAEVDQNEKWGKAILGICIVANSKDFVHSSLDVVLKSIESNRDTLLQDYHTELIHL